MARTTNGKLRGRAARTQLRDEREYLLDMQRKAQQELKRKQELARRMMIKLAKLEGEAFITWWDEELPPRIDIDQQLRLLEQRLRQVVLSRITPPTPTKGAQQS